MPVSLKSLNWSLCKKVRLTYDDGSISEKELEVCNGFFSRLKGMLFVRKKHDNKAWLIMPCDGVHTFFMAYAIDVIFLDVSGEIVFCGHLPVNRIKSVKGSYAVLEGTRLLKLNHKVVEVEFLC